MPNLNHFKELSQLISNNLPIKDKSIIYLLRHAQSLGNYSGSIIGWTDSKLSIKGRQQANLLYRGLYQHTSSFTQIHSSDLSRCTQTLKIALGFSDIKFNKDKRLREMNFGDQEGIHYDSLAEEEKNIISSLQYKPPNGQTWPIARQRAIKYFSELKHGHHLICTHGGLMCALTHHFGLTKVVPNCSVICVEFCHQKQDLSSLKFVWQFEKNNA